MQLFVQVGDAVRLDVAEGETLGGARLSPAHLHNVHCATKPLLPLAIGRLLDAGAVNLDTDVTAVLPEGHALRPPAGVQLGDVLRHVAGMTAPSAAFWRMARPAHRRKLLQVEGTTAGVGYSELTGWLVLEAIVEAVTGADAATFLATEIIEPLELGDGLFVALGASPDAVLARVRVPFAGLPDEVIPLLSEMIPSQIADIRPAFGGLATMSALGRLYAALGRLVRGVAQPGLPTPESFARLLADRRGPVFDPILGCTMDFAGGFMRSLDGSDGISPHLGPEVFGHTAGFVNCMAFHDPAHELSVACFVNGIQLERELIYEPRRAIVDAIFADMEETG